MEELKELMKRAEALLFAAGKPVSLKQIMRICGVRSRRKIEKILEELVKKYEADGGALELVQLHGDKWFLKLRKEYMELVGKYLRKPMLGRGVMRTLAFIAYHQPITQSDVAAARGNQAYNHIKMLLEKGLIEAEKQGRTLVLRTSPLFAEYFGVENNPKTIRRKISQYMREEKRK